MSGLEQFTEVETGEAFTVQNQHLLKVELSQTTVMARSGAMVAYQGDVRFEHKGGGVGRPAQEGGDRREPAADDRVGSGEMFLANRAMLVRAAARRRGADRQRRKHPRLRGGHRLGRDARQGRRAGDARRWSVQHPPAGTGQVALCSDGIPVKLSVDEAPTFADPAGGDRLVWRRRDQRQGRCSGEEPDRTGLGREHPEIGFCWVLAARVARRSSQRLRGIGQAPAARHAGATPPRGRLVSASAGRAAAARRCGRPAFRRRSRAPACGSLNESSRPIDASVDGLISAACVARRRASRSSRRGRSACRRSTACRRGCPSPRAGATRLGQSISDEVSMPQQPPPVGPRERRDLVLVRVAGDVRDHVRVREQQRLRGRRRGGSAASRAGRGRSPG